MKDKLTRTGVNRLTYKARFGAIAFLLLVAAIIALAAPTSITYGLSRKAASSNVNPETVRVAE